MTPTPPAAHQPRTAAGRALLEALPLDEWHPINREIVIEHILAIEAEAAPDAALLREALNKAQAAIGGFLWLANNLDNTWHDPVRFREFFGAATDDARLAYEQADAALSATPPQPEKGEAG